MKNNKRGAFIDLTYGYSNNMEYLQTMKAIMKAFDISAKEAEEIFYEDRCKTAAALEKQGWEKSEGYDGHYPASCGCCYGEYTLKFHKLVEVYSLIKDVTEKELLRDIFDLDVQKYHEEEYFWPDYNQSFGSARDFKRFLVKNKVITE